MTCALFILTVLQTRNFLVMNFSMKNVSSTEWVYRDRKLFVNELLGGETKGLPSYLMPFPMYFQMSPDIHRFSSLTAPIMPPWFLDVEKPSFCLSDRQSLYILAQTFQKPVQTYSAHSDSVCTHLCAQKGGMSPAAQMTHIFWDVFRKCVNSPLQVQGKPASIATGPQSLGALMVCGGWHLTLLLAHFAFSKSLIDSCCQDGYYPSICLFPRLAVQSHLTQQCQMKLQKGQEDTQKTFQSMMNRLSSYHCF